MAARMSEELKKLVADSEKALRFPHSALRLWRLAHDPAASARQVAHVIERDPALAARVLKLANSPLYPYPGQVADIHCALAMIGMREIAELALTAACVSGFGPIESELLRRSDFWWHSFSCALLARDLSRSFAQAPEEAFTAGLLHDIGQMLLFSKRPQLMIQVLHDSLTETAQMPILERGRFDFDHAELGGEMLRAWKLPERLCAAVSHHHRSWQELEQEPLANLVRLANRGAVPVEADGMDDGEQIQSELCDRLGFDTDTLPGHLGKNRERADGLCAALAL